MERTFWKVTRWARAARFWVYMLLVVAAFFGCNEARGQDYSGCSDPEATNALCPDREAASAAVSAAAAHRVSLYGGGRKACGPYNYPAGSGGGGLLEMNIGWDGYPCVQNDGNPEVYREYTQECSVGDTWNDETQQCDGPPDCSVDDPPLGPSLINTPTADAWQACDGGCSYIDMDGTSSCQRIDGSFWCSSEGWQATGLSCSPGTPQTGQDPPTDTDGDGVSDGNDSNPQNPGETGDNDGEGDGDDSCGAEGQPACNNDGGTSGAGNTSVGGASCDSPPNSNGDAILAQIAFQTWATRCAVQGNANQGGGTGVIPGDGDGSTEVLEDIRDWLDGDGQELDTPEDPWVEGEGVEPSDWSLGLGSTGTCPAPISETITIAGHSQDIELSFQPLCDFAGVLRTMMIALGALVAAYIIAGVRR